MTKLDTLKKQTAEMEAELEETTAKLEEMKAEIDRLENGWEMKCPYKIGDNYWIICDSGEFEKVIWNDYNLDKEVFIAGNAFLTREAAELESKRRNLLTRFKAFRDECNNGWKPDWSNHERKWSISKNEEGPFETWAIGLDIFSLFGYFKNEEDCKKAIDLFGGEIKELFM